MKIYGNVNGFIYRESQREHTMPPEGADHGTLAMYSAGCRCTRCERAMLQHDRDMRRSRNWRKKAQ